MKATELWNIGRRKIENKNESHLSLDFALEPIFPTFHSFNIWFFLEAIPWIRAYSLPEPEGISAA